MLRDRFRRLLRTWAPPGSVIAMMGLHPARQNASQLLIGNSRMAIELPEPWHCTQMSLPGLAVHNVAASPATWPRGQCGMHVALDACADEQQL